MKGKGVWSVRREGQKEGKNFRENFVGRLRGCHLMNISKCPKLYWKKEKKMVESKKGESGVAGLRTKVLKVGDRGKEGKTCR